MAPVSFYPAVDNPEYFHVSSTDARKSVHELDTKLGEPVNNSAIEGKTTNGDSSRECNISQKENAEMKLSPEPSSDSDSDCPPEVPPRSQQSLSIYVNTPSIVTGSTNKPFLGDYIFTKSELSPTSPSSLENNRLSTGSSTIISPDGATSVHNVLYCSNLPQKLDNSPAKSVKEESTSFTRSPTSPSTSILVSNIGYNLTPEAISKLASIPTTPQAHCNTQTKPAKPPTYQNVMSNSFYNVIPQSTSFIYKTPPVPVKLVELPKLVTPPESVKPAALPIPETRAPPVPAVTLLDDVTLQNPLKMKKKVTEAREREEEEAVADKQRLDEILAMCADYDKQVLDSPKNTQSQFHTLPQNRIKTNGSLPREKRSPSYSGSPIMMGLTSTGSCISPPLQISRGATPDEEPGSTFSYDGSHTSLNSSNTRSNTISNYPPFPLVANLSLNISPPSLHAISPYENVAQHYPIPHSPRTRIRTIVGKERKDCEIFENKMATGEFNAFNKISKFSDTSPVNRIRSLSSGLNAPNKPSRSSRMENSVVNDPLSKPDASMRSVITNKYFSDDQAIHASHYYDTPKHSHQSSNFHTIHYSNPSSFPVKYSNTASIGCKINNKVFEEHMIKNIRDSLNIQNVPEEIKRLREEQKITMELTADLRRKIDDLERQENEFLRELDIERALLEAELATTRDLLAEDERKLASLRSLSEDMDGRHQSERRADQDFIKNCKQTLDNTENSLETLEWKNETFHGTTDEETEMLELLKSQHESVEAERKFFLFYIRWKKSKKLFEDTEFRKMESEAQRENEREELNKEINELVDRISQHKEKLIDLEVQMTVITTSVCQETEDLENQRQQLIAKINKERMRLTTIGKQFSNLERLGVTSSNGQISPNSSGSDESCAPELAEKLAKLHLLDKSQEDLDLINQVTTSSPLGYSDLSMGRKTSATLQEIEKNRHLLLAKKGSLVIDGERKRVEALKQQVSDEVKAQWEEKKAREQREVNCTSLNSVGSEESSLPSSDVPTESISSDDAQRVHLGSIDVNRQGTILLRQRVKDLPSDDSMRPISDASSFCDVDGSIVRLRRDKSRTQRPLTRYLPVRTETHFDLRHHIESAGHQLEQCSHVNINATACRGQLYKLGSKFKAWQKRWFVFDRSKRALLYYGDKTESKPKGGACFQDIEEVYVDHQHSKSSQNLTFCVKTHQRVYHLMARSPEAMRIWIDVIFTGAEGYIEFQSGS